MLGLERAFGRHANVRRLLLVEPGQLDAQFAEMERGDLLVEMLGQRQLHDVPGAVRVGVQLVDGGVERAATQPRRRELALPLDEGRRDYIATQQAKVTRALDALEAEAGSLGALTTIGEVTIACALGYLDFRYANEPWRPGHSKLEAWYAKVAALPAMARTAPPG